MHTVTHGQEASVRVALGEADREAAFGIRYAGYRQRGWIPSSPIKRLTDEYDELPQSTTFLVGSREQPFGTMRLVVDSEDHLLPLDHEGLSYVLEPFRRAGRRLAEVCKLAFLPAHWGASGTLLLELERLMYRTAAAAGVRDLVIGCVARDSEFYENTLLFER